MRYTLFSCDFDGTLVKGGGAVSQKNIDAIKEYRRRGGVFAVVTGRMLSSIRPRLLEMGLEDTLLAAYQGGVIAKTGTGEVLKDDSFSVNECVEILKYLEEYKELHVQIYADEKLYSNLDDELLKYYEKICGVEGIVSEGLFSEKVERERLRVPKICVILDPKKKKELYLSASEKFGERFSVTGSSEWMVEILPKSAHKATALKFLREYYHIPKEEVAAIGDELNDLSMISEAGGKFTVENGVKELKVIARVVPSCENDGVAEAISIALEEI